jgi:hypothetical protein
MFKVFKDAKVEVTIREMKRDDIRLVIQVENEMPHTFEKNAKENAYLQEMDLPTIQERFNGGTYIFNNGELIQYRDSAYRGFIRSADDMNTLSELVGTEKVNSRSGVSGMFESFRANSINKDYFLGGAGQTFNLDIKELGEGGSFENRLVHKWSPFDQNLIVSLETERLICTNGMVGMSSFVTKGVPFVNRYEEHLNLINVLLQPEYNNLLKNRFRDMSEQHASLASMMTAHSILEKRLKQNNISHLGTQTEESIKSRAKLRSFTNLLNVKQNLGNVYKNDAFSNKEQARHALGNLTKYDVFNILTEASSHTKGYDDNTKAIQKEINVLVFDELNDKKNVKGHIPDISSESDHRRAFFGDDE